MLATTLAAGRYQNWFTQIANKLKSFLSKADLTVREFYVTFGYPFGTLTGSEIQQYILTGKAGKRGAVERIPVKRDPRSERESTDFKGEIASEDDGLYSFAVENAKSAVRSQLVIAKECLAKGYDAEKIRQDK